MAKQKQSVFEKTMSILVMALSELYPVDKLSPGLVLAWLPREGMFYGSIARYDSKNDKQIMLSVKEPTLQDVLYELGAAWHRSTPNAQRLAGMAGMARKVGAYDKADRLATKRVLRKKHKRRKKV